VFRWPSVFRIRAKRTSQRAMPCGRTHMQPKAVEAMLGCSHKTSSAALNPFERSMCALLVVAASVTSFALQLNVMPSAHQKRQSASVFPTNSCAPGIQSSPRTADNMSAAWLSTCFSSSNDEQAAVQQSYGLYSNGSGTHRIFGDWLQPGNSSRSVLQCTFSSIPRVNHQIWVGKAPQPTSDSTLAGGY
jgi:hypothetical protein